MLLKPSSPFYTSLLGTMKLECFTFTHPQKQKNGRHHGPLLQSQSCAWCLPFWCFFFGWFFVGFFRFWETGQNHRKTKKRQTPWTSPPVSKLCMVSATWVCFAFLFPRASERRVLPIVGVCKTSSHLHIFSSSHLLIFTSSLLHVFSSSHLLIFASSHLHIFSSSHLLLLPSCPLALTSSHLHIFSSSQLLTFRSSHPHIFSSCPLALLPSCPLALLPSCPLVLLPSCPLALLPSCPLALLPSCPLALLPSYLLPSPSCLFRS